MDNTAKIQEAIEYIPADDRDLWLNIGFALQDELGDNGFPIFDSWSSRSDSYNQRDTQSVWKSFKGGSIKIATLFHYAKENGWQPEAGVTLAAAQKDAQEATQEAAKQRREAEQLARAVKQEDAAKKALEVWKIGTSAKENPYLKRKSADATDTMRQTHIDDIVSIISYRPKATTKKFADDPYLQGQALIIPVMVNGKFSTLELIDGDGRKSALAYGRKGGGYWATGKLPEGDGSGMTFVIGEGVATVLSGTADKHYGISALSCHNLPNVAQQIREQYPQARIIILSDIGNGEKDATRAALENGGDLFKPVFPEGAIGDDANDLAAIIGGEALHRLIEAAVPPEAEPINDTEEGQQSSLASRLRPGSYYAALEITLTWIVQSFIPEGALILLFGSGGMGKTTLLMQIFGAVGQGLELFGLKTAKRQVIYVDYENPIFVLKKRCIDIDTGGILFLDSTSKPPKLDKPEREQYLELLKVHPGAVIIFDTLKSSHSGDENDSRAMSVVMEFLRDLRDAGATVIILHHTPKGNNRQYKGSGAIFDLCDHVLALYPVKKPGDESEVVDDDDAELTYRFGTSQKTRYELARMFLSFDSDTRQFILAPDPAEQDKETIKRAMLTLAGRSTVINQTSLIDELADKVPQKKLRSLLTAGTGTHWETKKGSHNSTIYTPIQVDDSVRQFGNPIGSCQTAELEPEQGGDAGTLARRNTMDTPQIPTHTEFGSSSDPSCQTAKLDGMTTVDECDLLLGEVGSC